MQAWCEGRAGSTRHRNSAPTKPHAERDPEIDDPPEMSSQMSERERIDAAGCGRRSIIAGPTAPPTPDTSTEIKPLFEPSEKADVAGKRERRFSKSMCDEYIVDRCIERDASSKMELKEVGHERFAGIGRSRARGERALCGTKISAVGEFFGSSRVSCAFRSILSFEWMSSKHQKKKNEWDEEVASRRHSGS